MTLSLVSRCAETGRFGVVIASSSPAVAARCVYTRAGVGAVASQNITDPRLGPLTLDWMEKGLSAIEALDKVKAGADHIEYRQILAIDKRGQTALHSGGRSLGIWADESGKDVLAAGNLLANKQVPAAMVQGFEKASGDLGDRLLEALKAGLKAGGEMGPIHSAGMQICDEVSWPVADLRCDWAEDPLSALETTWTIYKPQLDDYVRRAIDPREAPSYGVPGDL